MFKKNIILLTSVIILNVSLSAKESSKDFYLFKNKVCYNYSIKLECLELNLKTLFTNQKKEDLAKKYTGKEALNYYNYAKIKDSISIKIFLDNAKLIKTDKVFFTSSIYNILSISLTKNVAFVNYMNSDVDLSFNFKLNTDNDTKTYYKNQLNTILYIDNNWYISNEDLEKYSPEQMSNIINIVNEKLKIELNKEIADKKEKLLNLAKWNNFKL